MVKENFERLFRVYQFITNFFVGNEKKDIGFGFYIVNVTSRGLEFWRAMRPGETLIEHIGDATKVEIILVEREGKLKRTMLFDIGDPKYLPFGLPTRLHQGRVDASLDATLDAVALEGVIFTKADCVALVETEVDEAEVEHITMQFVTAITYGEVLAEHDPSWSDDFCRAQAALNGSQEKVDDLPFPKARRVMAKALHDDEGLRLGYVANVAMLLHDRYGITDYETRNKAAEEILALIFESQ